MRRLWFLVKGNEAATLRRSDDFANFDRRRIISASCHAHLVCVANIENCSAQCVCVCVLIPAAAAAAGKRAMDL